MLSTLASPLRPVPPSRGGRSADRVILIDRTPCADILSDPEGRAVWPIGLADDMVAISRECDHRSITLREVVGRPVAINATQGAVSHIGNAAVADLARLYAHLTGRAYLPYAIADLPSDAVIVTTFAALTSDLLASLYSPSSAAAAAGLICAANIAGLRRQVLVRATFAAFPVLDSDLPWTAIFPAEAIGGPRRTDLRVLGADSPAAEVREAIISRSGLLAIATHSDGVDAMLAPSLALCGVTAEQLAAPVDREPSCLVSNHCHRFDVPIAKVAALEATIKPADISTGVMVFDTCFGILAADAPINIERGLGRHLVENFDIGALVTTWELTMLDLGKLQGLVVDLANGMSLGSAIARFNRSSAARHHAARLALFGDPRTRFSPRPAARSWMRTQSDPIIATPVAAADMLQELGFSRACLEQGVANLSTQLASRSPVGDGQIRRQLAVAHHAMNLLREFELNVRDGPINESNAAALRRALIEDAFVRRPLDDWKTFADKTEWHHCHCVGCDAPSWVGIVGVRIPGVSPRRVVLCPRCNLSEDMPAHVRLNLRYDAADGICRLVGALPERDWSAALIIRTRDESRDRMWAWPLAPGGEPAKHMRLPEPLPPGPVRLAIIVAHGGWLAWTASDMHGGPVQ